jgi:hypothetical protein
LTTAIQLARIPKKAKPSAAARPSAAEKGGLGVSPGYDTTQHAHAQRKAKCSGQVERSEEKGLTGGDTRALAPHSAFKYIDKNERGGRPSEVWFGSH